MDDTPTQPCCADSHGMPVPCQHRRLRVDTPTTEALLPFCQPDRFTLLPLVSRWCNAHNRTLDYCRNERAEVVDARLWEAVDEPLLAALAQIEDITKPVSMTMQGPRWMHGDGDIFGGGNRERVWRIAHAALEAADRAALGEEPTP